MKMDNLKQSSTIAKLKRSFLIHNILLYLIPVLLPLFIISASMLIIVNTFVKDEIDKRNKKEISARINNIDETIDSLENLNIVLSNNPSIKVRLKNIISRIDQDGIKSEDYEMVNTIIDLIFSYTSINKNLLSLYIYFNSSENWFISSTNRFTNFNFYYDTTWIDSYEEHLFDDTQTWFEFRTIDNYGFQEDNKVNVFTIYQKIYSSGKASSDGVLVLNIDSASINKLLGTIFPVKNETITILDNQDTVIFSSGTKDVKENKQSITYEIASSVYNWKYVYTKPYKEAYRIPIFISRFILITNFISCLLGLIIAYIIPKRNCNQIIKIANQIVKAKEGNLTAIDSNTAKTPNTLYEYITTNVVGSFLQIDYLELKLSERRYHIKSLELQSLQSQLNPHFLYNTIQTILWETIALTGRPNKASAMIEDLSDILHYSLDDNLSYASIYDEIKVTNAYVAILQTRYSDQFKLLWDFSNLLDDIKIPKLLFQPLIENSIHHGIRDKQLKNSYIRISLKLINQSKIKIRVIDNGTGMDYSKLKEVRKQLYNTEGNYEHIGLNNTYKRLLLMYGKESVKFFITSKAGKGTIITIILPASSHKLDE